MSTCLSNIKHGKYIFQNRHLNDLPTLYRFEQQIIAAERPFDPTLKPGHINYYDLKAKVLDSDSIVIVATIADEVISSGYASIQTPSEYLNFKQYAYLGFMYVKSEHRGKGVIGNLIEELKSWVLSRNINEIRLEVYNDNAAALKAYERAGFKRHIVVMRARIEPD